MIENHPQIADINTAIIAGVPLREIGERFNVNYMAVYRYKKRMNSRGLSMVKAERAARKETDETDVIHDEELNIAGKLRDLEIKARSIYTTAMASGKANVALTAIRELSRLVDLYVKAAAELRQQRDRSVFRHPDFLAYQQGLIEVLADYPEAAEAIVEYSRQWT